MIEFFKMSGSGNDFILMDDRENTLPVKDLRAFVRKVCERKVSVGADGLIVIKPSVQADFKWLFFNADGSEAEMCGNGGRCAARYAFIKGIAGSRLSFETVAGIIDAEVRGEMVKLRLTDPKNLNVHQTIAVDGESILLNSVNTGVPHAVVISDDIDRIDVFSLGRAIRYHEAYKPAGTNANFIQILDRQTIRVRTYERGVEGETLACGTGAVASALISAEKGMVESPVNVLVKSGEMLKIHFERKGKGFENVYLEGSAKVVYQGSLWEEAYA
jgi:diaminopimelate epimerase